MTGLRLALPALAPRWMGAFAALALACFATLGAADPFAGADASWQWRAEGARDGVPEITSILQTIGGYEAALNEQPEQLEGRWKLLRALHFAGQFAAHQPERRREFFERGKQVSEAGLDRLMRAVGSAIRLDELEASDLTALLDRSGIARGEVARLYFWAAIHWGAWSREAGPVATVREGVASRLSRYSETVLALDPCVEDGGAYRLLGRLNAQLPRIPFVTGWVDRDRAIPLLEQANALAPTHPGNRLLLAVTLLDLAPERGAEARALLEAVALFEPRPATEIEDYFVRDEARRRLLELNARESL